MTRPNFGQTNDAQVVLNVGEKGCSAPATTSSPATWPAACATSMGKPRRSAPRHVSSNCSQQGCTFMVGAKPYHQCGASASASVPLPAQLTSPRSTGEAATMVATPERLSGSTGSNVGVLRSRRGCSNVRFIGNTIPNTQPRRHAVCKHVYSPPSASYLKRCVKPPV